MNAPAEVRPRGSGGRLIRILGFAGTLLGASLTTPHAGDAQVYVYIQPAYGEWPAGTQVSVSIEYCAYSEQFDGPGYVWFNGQDVSSEFPFTSAPPGGSCYGATDYGTAQGTVTLVSGQNALTSGISTWTQSGQETATYTVTVPPPPSVAPQVTPDGASRLIAPITGAKLAFTVKNMSTSTRTYTLSVACTGVVTNCTVASPLTLAVGQTMEVWATFTVAGTTFQTGSLSLTATDQGSPNPSDGGSISVKVAPTGPVVDRSVCLTIAAGPAAAYECGDLRLAHALPGVRTVNTGRAPVLLYNSQHARPYPLVQADVTAPSPLPQTIRAVLKIGSTVVAQRDIAGSVWGSAGQVRRVVLGFAADTFPTGLYAYDLEIQRLSAGQFVGFQWLAGQLPIVNRRASVFGPGWWLAGWEKLFFAGLPSGQVLWVAGDGSVRRYERAGTVGTDTAYVATPVDRPDTLLHTSTNQWVRLVPGGARVVFTANGTHRRTISRLSDSTEFFPDSTIDWKLVKIRVPRDAALEYTFSYGGTPLRLSSVSVPDSAVGAVRLTTLSWVGDTLKITDPGSPAAVAFAYDPAVSYRIISRKNRLGAITVYSYDGASRLAWTRLYLAGGDSIRPTFCAAEVSGLAACNPTPVVPDSAYTRFDGPRTGTDSADVHSFWVDGRGAPWKIRDPYGSVTTLTRAEPSWPALVTRALYPNGRVLGATYDARGNLATSTDSSVYVTGQHATTRHQWDQRWDAVTEAVLPTGQVTRFGYDAANGNRLWQEDGRGTPSRVTFDYYTTAGGRGLVKLVTVPGGAKDSLGYDVRGNLKLTRTPVGYTDTIVSDRIGRPTVAFSTVAGVTRRDSTVYDQRGLVQRTASYGPAVNGAAAQKVVVRNFYNAEGQLDSLQRSASDSGIVGGTITTRWRYDLAGRRVAEVAPDHSPSAPRVDSTRYDPAGNAIAVVTRRGHTLTMVYDRLNRLKRREVPPDTNFGRYEGIATYPLNFNGRRPYPWFPTWTALQSPMECQTDPNCYETPSNWKLTIPGDTATFAYDSVGNMIRADNGAALIRRRYHKDGRIKSDTLKIRTYAGTDTLKHVYGMEHRYDLSGRRTVLKHPWQLAPRVGTAVLDSVRYVYDPVTGALQTAYDPLGKVFQFTYNLRNERIRLDLPGGIVQYLGYDADGRLVADTIKDCVSSCSPWSHPDATLRRASLTYVDAQRVGSAANALGRMDVTTAAYSGLGHLVRMEWWQPTATNYGNPGNIYSTERFTVDALGNIYSKYDSTNGGWRGGFGGYSGSTVVTTRGARFLPVPGQPPAGRLRGSSEYARRDTAVYDAAGNTVFSAGAPMYPSGAVMLEDRASFYGADGQLRAADYRQLPRDPSILSDLWDWRVAFEEYRYDALGRRVLVRTRRTCRDVVSYGGTNTLCAFSTMRRTVWEGAEELYEIQVRDAGADDPPPPSAEADTALFIQPPTSPNFWDPNRKLGRVAYLHGPGLDQPLSITRLNFTDYPNGGPQVNWAPLTVVPHWNWRGQADYGTMGDGGWKTCQASPPTRCVSVAYSHKRLAYVQQAADTGSGWWGTLLDLKEDGTGTYYRRNRYLDPATGRFTQEDPIGLAGGLNLYGFAAGDPVNFSDPFGLCPWHDIECWEDKMWAASGGSGFAGRVLAPLGSTALEITGLSSVDRGAKDAAGGSALAMGGLILDIGSSAVPGGRQGKTAVRELIRHATDNPGAWRTVAAFVERAVSKKARGGVSIQRVIQNEAGDQLVEHTILNKAGDVVEQHFRPMLKPPIEP